MDGFKGAVIGTIADVKEAVVKPVVDEVGKTLEQAAQTVISGSPKPQQFQDPLTAQKKQEENLKKIQGAVWRIEQLKNTEGAIQKVREKYQQEEMGKTQEEQKEKQVKQFKVIEEQKKTKELTQVQLKERAAEIKGGVGG